MYSVLQRLGVGPAELEALAVRQLLHCLGQLVGCLPPSLASIWHVSCIAAREVAVSTVEPGSFMRYAGVRQRQSAGRGQGCTHWALSGMAALLAPAATIGWRRCQHRCLLYELVLARQVSSSAAQRHSVESVAKESMPEPPHSCQQSDLINQLSIAKLIVALSLLSRCRVMTWRTMCTTCLRSGMAKTSPHRLGNWRGTASRASSTCCLAGARHECAALHQRILARGDVRVV